MRRLTMKRFAGHLARMDDYERALPAVASEQFRQRITTLAQALRREGITEELALQTFAAARLVIAELLGFRLHPPQLLAGWTMLLGGLAEMQTGEGKTLTASLPAIVMGLAGTPVHVVTVNDYLVRRDASRLQPLYRLFGLRTGMILDTSSSDDRRRAYAREIVYGTSKQLAFDYLRDLQALAENRAGLTSRLRALVAPDAPEPAMRGLCFAIVDEADSILADDARTPLILAEPLDGEHDRVTEAAVALSIARGLHEGVDYEWRERERTALLTDAGRQVLAQLANRLLGVWRFERYRTELVRQALAALHGYRANRDYLVKDGCIQLIDGSTGRLLADRKLQHGLHRMLEIKERCRITEDNHVVAAISFQRFFGRYHHLAGMQRHTRGAAEGVAPHLRGRGRSRADASPRLADPPAGDAGHPRRPARACAG